MSQPFDRDVMTIDAEAVTAAIEQSLARESVRTLHRRGLVLGVSGGVDSAVCLALAVRALGPDRVVALLMPEWETDDGSTTRAQALCDSLGVTAITEHIGPILEAAGCYRRRDDAIRELVPDYTAEYRQKITIAGDLLDTDRLPFFNLTVEAPSGERQVVRMPAPVYQTVVAATNMKQRTRKMIEYFHAEARNFAVLGTPNRLEYELGFFVRGGDGLADIKPVAHLYKTQVYALAAFLEIPDSIRSLPPSTDTYSLPQTQEEFYFALPYAEMDLMLWAWEHGVEPADAGAPLGLDAVQVDRVYRDIEGKRKVSERSLAPALLLEPVDVGERP